MKLKHLLRSARKYAQRIILPRSSHVSPEAAIPGEQPAGWYDAVFSESPHYDVHYTKTAYYSLWCVIVDRLRQQRAARVLEVGCGTGQFAEMLYDEGIASYLGFDFSEVAVRLAKKRVPQYMFLVADALNTDIFKSYQCDAIVCTEVLEHIEDDLRVVARFPSGCRCLCTVPNFPYVSHVRHFDNANAVAERYSSFFDDFSVTTLRGVRGESERFFLMDGRRRVVAGE
jgi:2-polyprenyl-3-methyl-5-hydroxy-6-metoxy-1,4-benzoquinol methylase